MAALDFLNDVQRFGTPGINPNAPNPHQQNQPLPQNPLDKFLGGSGGSLLMNLLAQQGFSTTPQSPFGALGRGLQQTQAQGIQRGRSALEDELIRSRIGLNRASAETATSGQRIVQSAQPLANGNIGFLNAFTGELVDTGHKAGGKGQIIDMLGIGQVEYDPIQGTLTQVNPEDVIRQAGAGRELAEAEAGRGRLQTPGGGFEAVPGTEADIKRIADEKKAAGGALMKSIQSQTVVEDVSRLNEMMGSMPFGRQAALQASLSPILQSDAFRNGTALIESVKGNVGIDSLLRIKATGAGLGQVPQSQLDLLSRLLGELNLNQSKEQFVHTWDRMGTVYEQIWKNADQEMIDLGLAPPEVFTIIDTSSELPEGVTQEMLDAMTPEERALF